MVGGATTDIQEIHVKRFMMMVVLAGAVAASAACSSDSPEPSPATTVAPTTTVAATTTVATPTQGNTAPTNNQGAAGADGSTGNNLSKQYCAQNQDPGCPAGSYVGPNAIPNPNGDGTYVPCEGSICTSPNHGAGTDPSENGGDQSAGQGQVEGAPCEGTGTWVRLEGGNAAHYGTEWMCAHR